MYKNLEKVSESSALNFIRAFLFLGIIAIVVVTVFSGCSDIKAKKDWSRPGKRIVVIEAGMSIFTVQRIIGEPQYGIMVTDNGNVYNMHAYMKIHKILVYKNGYLLKILDE